MKVHSQSYRATKKPGEVIKYFLYSVLAVLLAADVMASDVSKDDILEFIDKVVIYQQKSHLSQHSQKMSL